METPQPSSFRDQSGLEKDKLSRIREIKQAKSQIEGRLDDLESKTNSLIKQEMRLNNQSFDIKLYLDNFEKDKDKAKLASDKLNKLRQERQEKLAVLKQIEEKNKEIQQINLKKAKKLNLTRIKEERDKNAKALNRSVEIVNSPENNSVPREYSYQRMLKEFEKREGERLLEEELKKNKIKLARKQRFRAVKKEEIQKFGEEFDFNRRLILEDLEANRLFCMEDSSSVSFAKSKAYLNYVKKQAEDKKNKLLEEYKREYLAKKKANYAKYLKKVKIPVVDRTKRENLERMIREMTDSTVKPHVRKTKSVLFKIKKKAPELRRYSVEIRTPLAKNPDYLKEIKISPKENKLASKISVSTVKNSLPLIKREIELMDEKTERKALLLKYKADPALYGAVSSMLVDSAEARMTVLEHLTKNKD